MEFKIVSLNVNSIVNYGRRFLLNEFIATHGAHVYCIQETKFGGQHKFSFPQYSTFLSTRAIGTGGVLLLVHNSIKIRNLRTIGGIIDGVFVDILISGNWATVGSVYVGPTCGDLSPLTTLINKCEHFMIGGDFNARDTIFRDASSNYIGRLLINWAVASGCRIINPSSPTCYHSTDGTHIDKFITDVNFPQSYSSINNLSSFSDHNGIAITIHCNAQTVNAKNGFTLKQYGRVNTTRLNRHLERKFAELDIPTDANMLPGDLEILSTRINDILMNAAINFVPTRTIRAGGIILSGQSRALLGKYHNSQRRLRRQINMGAWMPGIMTTRNEIGLLRQMSLQSVGRDLSDHYRDKMANTTSMRDAYRNVKQCTSYRKRGACPDVIYTDNTKSNAYTGPGEIANGFLERFSANHELTCHDHSSADADVNLFANKVENADLRILFNERITPKIGNNIELEEINNELPMTQGHILTSSEEVNSIIRGVSPKKSTGIDQMPYIVIKTFSPKIILFISMLFNQLLACSHFPSKWKHSRVTPIPKVGKDASIIENWRPISNLNCISKIFERLLAKRLLRHIDSINIFPDQFGFLAGHSPVHALGRLQSAINTGLNEGKFTTLVSLDIRAAFDTVWHRALIFKMGKLKFPAFIIKMIGSFLTGRSFAVQVESFTSNSKSMPAGTPQGSVCSPILFNIFLYDLPRDEGNFVKNIQFADDTSSFCTSGIAGEVQCALNIHLLNLAAYFRTWKLLLNERKTLMLNFLGFAKDSSIANRRRFGQIKIQVNGRILPIEKRIRLLGVIFDRNNRFVGHIDHVLVRARRSFFALRPLLRSRLIDAKVKTNIYKTYIRPIIVYASAIWARSSSLSAHQMERLRSFERRIIRMTANVKRDVGSYKYLNNAKLHETAGVIRIDRYIIDSAVRFFDRCAISPSERIANLVLNRTTGLFTSLAEYWHRSAGGNLLENGKLLVFHEAYDRSGRSVYNTNQ